jgi:hypothetical protein
MPHTLAAATICQNRLGGNFAGVCKSKHCFSGSPEVIEKNTDITNILNRRAKWREY